MGSFVTNATLAVAGVAVVILFMVSSWKALTGKSNLLHWRLTAVLFYIGVLCFISQAFLPNRMDHAGRLQEPFFFLIPIGFLLLCLGGTSAIARLVLDSVKGRNRMRGMQAQ
jgi:hypothetical protein